MADTSDKREAGKFEPPPWEREQFEELQRKKEGLGQQEKRDHEAPALDRSSKQPLENLPLVEPKEEKVARAEEAEDKPATDDKVVAAMLMQLQHEEPAQDSSLWKIGVGFSAAAAAIGLVLIVWGIAAMIRTGSLGAAGLVGATILMAFGGLFVGLGIWMAVRSLKQRGVL